MLDKKQGTQVFITVETKMLFQYIKHRQHFLFIKKHHFKQLMTQFLLTLAWTVTIHKCQGLTLSEIVIDMTCAKGKFKPGEAYVAFSRVKILDKLHIINYTQGQIHVSEHVEKEMKRLRKNILPQMPSNLFQDIPGGVKIVHLNIGNLKRKMEDIKDEDIVKNSHIISVNETHLGHSDILTPDMMGISKDNNNSNNNNNTCICIVVI